MMPISQEDILSAFYNIGKLDGLVLTHQFPQCDEGFSAREAFDHSISELVSFIEAVRESISEGGKDAD